jgi:hypothetical protein
MSTVNYTNTNLDLTVRVFDQFYDYDVNVPAAEYDVVHSYFLSVMTTRQAAGNFTVSLFRVARRHRYTSTDTVERVSRCQRHGPQCQLGLLFESNTQ